MRYRLRSAMEKTLHPVQRVLEFRQALVKHRLHPLANSRLNRLRAAAIESTIRLIKPYPKQSFNYAPITVPGHPVSLTVDEEVVLHKPFCELRRFSTALSKDAPKVLFVAAMSGHHATLSKETLQAFLPGFDVYITDWVDARLVPLQEGHFDFEDYVSYLIEFLQHLGPNVHLIGLCQAAVPALCATALMAEDKDKCRPATLSLLAGPIDVRVNPNNFIKRTESLPHSIMKMHIHTVPKGYPGVGRKVYPGYMQLMGFVSLNLRNHVRKHVQFFKDVAAGNLSAAEKHREFYDEYNAMMDSTAEFYLQTLERVFFDQHLAKGTMHYRARLVNPAAIRDIPLLTLEGENDDMVAIGVTEAAHALCVNLPDKLREHRVEPGVGHYGIFNGTIYRNRIAPRMMDFMQRYPR